MCQSLPKHLVWATSMLPELRKTQRNKTMSVLDDLRNIPENINHVQNILSTFLHYRKYHKRCCNRLLLFYLPSTTPFFRKYHPPTLEELFLFQSQHWGEDSHSRCHQSGQLIGQEICMWLHHVTWPANESVFTRRMEGSSLIAKVMEGNS